MPKVTIDFSIQQIELIVARLPIQQKLKLVRKLEKETLKERWKRLLKGIQDNLKKYPMSEEEMDQEIQQARKEHYANKSHR